MGCLRVNRIQWSWHEDNVPVGNKETLLEVNGSSTAMVSITGADKVLNQNNVYGSHSGPCNEMKTHVLLFRDDPVSTIVILLGNNLIYYLSANITP